MGRNWEDSFRSFIAPASDTEAEKQDNAERMVRDAIFKSPRLPVANIRVFTQGSYHNNTNVRKDSDVDICVCCDDPFFFDLSGANYAQTEANIVNVTYTFAQFKNDVQAALEEKFGKAGVTRGNKAFDVHANTYRVDGDVVPAFAFRKYKQRAYNPLLNSFLVNYIVPVGTRFYSDDWKEVTNWPEQQYTNGVNKNQRTGRRYKSLVRALKRLKYEMEDKNSAAAKPIASFLIECLVYNVSDALFTGYSYAANVKDCVAACWNATRTDDACKNWLEVNELKYLFSPTQPWTRQQVNDFMLAAWRYCEFQ